MTGQDSAAAAARAARESYGRLMALLAASTRDIALAEDALADAFERALRTWPTNGVPENPQGWLMTVARNRIRDLLAAAAVRTAAPLDDDLAAAARPIPTPTPSPTSGWSCCSRAPTRPSTPRYELRSCSKSCSASTRIASLACSRCNRPRWRSAWSGRSAASATPVSRSVCRRARTCLCGCPPCSKPSTAPMQSTGSTSTSAYANRSPMRPGGSPCSPPACSTPSPRHGVSLRCSPSPSHGHPLERARRGRPSTIRTPALWDRSLIAEGEALLRRAHALGSPLGRFQLEAAIQSAHCDRARTGTLDRATIVHLYRGLVAIAPTTGAVEALAALTTPA